MNVRTETRTYLRAECVVFRKTNEAFGDLSNMAPGYPVRVNSVRLATVEALYQACRFPHLPDVQQLIIAQHSPMTAKMVSKPHRKESRPDWDQVRVRVMRWCLRTKLSQHWSRFSELLISTGDRAIVEDSRKDDFWGAIPTEDGMLVGMNVLGRLLMELREAIKQGAELTRVEPAPIADFLLLGESIQVIDCGSDDSAAPPVRDMRETAERDYGEDVILPLFAEPVIAARSFPPVIMSTNAERSRGMIEGLKPYPEYKESGLPWLGRGPSHWVTKRGKSYMTAIDRRSKAGQEELLTVSSARGVVPRNTARVTMFKAESYAGYKLCWPGDLVINSLWAWGGGLGVSQHHGIISTAYSVYRPRTSAQMNPRFLHELVRSSAFHWELQVRSKGVWISRLQLTDTSFLDAPIPLPPPDEQAAIARFLDYANQKIDGFIRAKRKLIALLNEQKQAIIHRAVTRGLRPGGPLKPTGIPWLGEIPEHWEVRRLKTLVSRIDQGVSPQASSYLADGDSWGVLKSGCVNHGAFRQTEHKQLAKDFEIDPSIVVRVGDVLISRACGSPKLVGSVGRVRALNYKLILSDKTFRAAFRPIVDSEFMVYAMNGVYYRQQVEQAISGADGMANNLPLSELRSFVFAIPPLAEAAEIASQLESELVRFNAAIARTEREIALILEYRTRLTADIVTGKLDVREAAAKLPELSGAAVSEPVADDDLAELEAEEIEA